jgi:hypothetical protein
VTGALAAGSDGEAMRQGAHGYGVNKTRGVRAAFDSTGERSLPAR